MKVSRKSGQGSPVLQNDHEHVTGKPAGQSRGFRSVIQELAGIILSVLLFYLANPNDISHDGFGLLGYVSLLPLMWTIHRAPLWRLAVYGPFIGFFTYALFNLWLVNFHPLAIFIVPVIYAAYYLLLIPLLKLPVLSMGSYAWIAQLFIWLGYEYLRTRGFLGYAYGIVGYTQYLNIPLVNVASLTGVWGVSLLVILPQFFAAQILADPERWNVKSKPFLIPAVSILVLHALAVSYGTASQVDYSQAPRVKMALVQQNVDPKIGGTRAYRNSMDASIRQTRLALEQAPDTELVVWSETSFIPAIDFHSRYRTQPERYELVDELLEYIDSTNVPVLLGNGDGQLRLNEEGEYIRNDYNAVYLYRDRDDSEIYRKLHLVPFTEHFPYERQFPWLHRLLVENDTSFWEKGEEWTIFRLEQGLEELDSLQFATPICFEDTFGYLSRGFVQRGAQLIINLTNDSWAESIPSATQHLAMAVFRTTENRRSMVRSTNGGMTAVIDPNGRIIDSNEPFTESYIVSDVPVYTASDGVYTRLGDLFAYIFLISGIISVIAAVVLLVIRSPGNSGR